MGESSIGKFRKDREAQNALVMKYAGKTVKKFYNVDMNAYQPGALDRKTKEMLGLVASFVLRCDDCVLYHLDRCREEGVTDREVEEALAVGLVVGGSITIPHLRRALRAWDGMKGSRTG